jgi:hypothetical protein
VVVVLLVVVVLVVVELVVVELVVVELVVVELVVVELVVELVVEEVVWRGRPRVTAPAAGAAPEIVVTRYSSSRLMSSTALCDNILSTQLLRWKRVFTLLV